MQKNIVKKNLNKFLEHLAYRIVTELNRIGEVPFYFMIDYPHKRIFI